MSLLRWLRGSFSRGLSDRLLREKSLLIEGEIELFGGGRVCEAGTDADEADRFSSAPGPCLREKFPADVPGNSTAFSFGGGLREIGELEFHHRGLHFAVLMLGEGGVHFLAKVFHEAGESRKIGDILGEGSLLASWRNRT